MFGPESGPQNQEIARALRSEFVIRVTGAVARRPEGTVNPKLDTGEIEVRTREVEILNKSLTPPVSPAMAARELPGDDLRLKYRYLDLRRPEMQENMVLRHRIVLSYNAEAEGETPDSVIARLIQSLPLHHGAASGDGQVQHILKA